MEFKFKTYSLGVTLLEDNDMFIIRYFPSWIKFGYYNTMYPGLIEALLKVPLQRENKSVTSQN